MRRGEKEINDQREIGAILHRGRIAFLALADDGHPYVVPVCYGFDGTALYVHTAQEGQKLDMLSNNARVCLAIVPSWSINPADDACDWGLSYESIIVHGTASILTDPAGKCAGLDAIMQQFTSYKDHTYTTTAIAKTCILKIEPDHITGKRS